MKKILLIAHFCGEFDKNDNSRFCYLASLLAEHGNDVEIVTSSFSFRWKVQKAKNALQWPFRITFIDEPGYTRSVCLKRLYSHFVWGNNLKNYLASHEAVDVVYCAIPSLTGAFKAAKYCKKTNTKFIVDIQDLWPEAFQMVFNVPLISNIIYKPFTVIADKIYRQADEIFAVSETYLKRALAVNRKCASGHCVYLGTDMEIFRTHSCQNTVMNKPSTELWIGYCGTLSHSYDLKCVMDAMVLIREKNVNPPSLVVIGDGPKKTEFEEYAAERNLPVNFAGWLSYEKMCGLLCDCDMVINPITKGSAGSIINKHADYAASALPVINTQESEEYRNLIEEYNMGINCRCGNSEDVANAVITLMENETMRKLMGQNALRCAMECFDRKSSYLALAESLEG